MSQTPSPIKVILVDDSSVVRNLLQKLLSEDPFIDVIATAKNGQEALAVLETHQPDVVLLDVEMPEMDGITALPLILKRAPNVRVVMCSSLTERGADITMKALQLGAVECIAKPLASAGENTKKLFEHLVLRTVKGLFPEKTRPRSSSSFDSSAEKKKAEDATVQMLRGAGSDKLAAKGQTPAPPPRSKEVTLLPASHSYQGRPQILAIGSSTGGPQALFQVLKELKDLPVPIVITQHMPATFTKMLADHIQQQTGIPACEGADNMPLENAKAYVAPGGYHMIFKRNKGDETVIHLDDGPPINFCKPAVDPMLESLLAIYKDKILGTILTGMGHDGLEGARKLVAQKSRIIAQDENSSVVWGMPGAVATSGLCSAVLPVQDIGPWIRRLF